MGCLGWFRIGIRMGEKKGKKKKKIKKRGNKVGWLVFRKKIFLSFLYASLFFGEADHDSMVVTGDVTIHTVYLWDSPIYSLIL